MEPHKVVPVGRSNAYPIRVTEMSPTDWLNWRVAVVYPGIGNIAVEHFGVGEYFYDLIRNQGADINNTEVEGNTPFIRAVLIDDYIMVDILMDLGADVLKKNEDGFTVFELVEQAEKKGKRFSEQTKAILCNIKTRMQKKNAK